MYKHLWTDASFMENVFSGYAMISYADLGKPLENVRYYETIPTAYYDRFWEKGDQIPVFVNEFDIQTLIEAYQNAGSDFIFCGGGRYPTDPKRYIDEPYLLLELASSLQAWNGWLDHGYGPEYYTMTDLRRLLNGYR